MELVLERMYFAEGTNGILFFKGQELCKSIELPWKENQRRVSCVPEGKYKIRKRFSKKFGWHLAVMNVKNRDLILIHPANDALKELNGCIAPVLEHTGEGKGKNSKIAFQKLKNEVFPLLESGFILYLIIKKT